MDMRADREVTLPKKLNQPDLYYQNCTILQDSNSTVIMDLIMLVKRTVFRTGDQEQAGVPHATG